MVTSRKSSSKARPKGASKRARATTSSRKRASASPARRKPAKRAATRAAKLATLRRGSSTNVAKGKKASSTTKVRKAKPRAKPSSKRTARPAGKTRVASSAGRTPTPDAPPRRKKLHSDVGEPEGMTPAQQSQKSPFDPRLERSKDQDQAGAIVNRNEKFSEEDWLTNKTGDPRIGTHGRRYEP